MSSNEDRNALLIPPPTAPITDDDKTALFIAAPRPQGAMSLAEVSQYLNVSEETVTSGLNHSLTHFEGSDRVKWFDPISVHATKVRIPGQVIHPFQSKASTDSDSSHPVFRRQSIQCSGGKPSSFWAPIGMVDEMSESTVKQQ
jgi:hypothetical protein